MTTRTYAEELGWTAGRLGGGLRHKGYYQAIGRRWPGIVDVLPYTTAFFIYDPPIGFLQGTNWRGCFAPYHDKWWRVNVYSLTAQPERTPLDVDAGIAAINKVLRQVMKPKNWTR